MTQISSSSHLFAQSTSNSHVQSCSSYGEKKIVKIGPVDPEIIALNLKNKEINESKIYSPIGKFAERAKKERPVYFIYTVYSLTNECHVLWIK